MKIEQCEYPDSLLYDVDAGTWAQETDGKFRVGIAPHFGLFAGGFTAVSLKEPGTWVEMGKSIGSAESPRHFDVVRAPFDCVVVEVNSRLPQAPGLANRSPYGEGWFAIVKRTGGSSMLVGISKARDKIAEHIRRRGVKCFAEFPDVEMVEVGSECATTLPRLNELLKGMKAGFVVHLVTDDPTSTTELGRWEKITGNLIVETRREGDVIHFVLKKR